MQYASTDFLVYSVHVSVPYVFHTHTHELYFLMVGEQARQSWNYNQDLLWV